MIQEENNQKFNMKNKLFHIAIFIFFSFVISSCTASEEKNELKKIVVSNSIIGDVAMQVSGGIFDIYVLMPAGIDPHGYQPTPQDIAKISDADLLMLNGIGLEDNLKSILSVNELEDKIVIVSDGIQIINGDPHVWLDPVNVITWVENIRDEFIGIQPIMELEIKENAENYILKLKELDTWIEESVAEIAAENRLLFSDHRSFTYFVNKYGFKQAGSIKQSSSSLAEPSAEELADLIDLINISGITAIFIGQEGNPELARMLTDDLDIQLVELYLGALSTPDGPAGNYIDLMRFNTEAIASALK